MKEKLGFWSIVLLGINCIIGTGIFGLPNKAYAMIGEASVGVIIFDALLVISIALCFAEAAGRFKVNGGPYIYAKEAFGTFFGYEVGLMKWLMGIIGWATFAVFLGNRLALVFPMFDTPTGRMAIAIFSILFWSVVNLMGVRSSKIVNNIVTLGKLLPLFLFIFAGIFLFGKVDTATLAEGAAIASPNGNTLVEAAILFFFAFTGFEAIGIAAGDMVDPQKNLPKAIVVVMLIVSAVYIAILLICMKVLGPSLAVSKAPVAEAAGVLLGKGGKSFIMTGILISIIGINMAGSYTSTKSGVALAETGLVPEFFLKTNSKGVHYNAVLASMFGTIILAMSGSFAALASIGVIVRFIQYIPTCAAVLIFRKRDRENGIKYDGFTIPFGSTVPIIALVVSIILLIKAGIATPHKIVYGLGGLVVVAPFYRFSKERMQKMDEKVALGGAN
ncbi:amino acid permease [Propionigenium maris DSM 9537]|uniref:Amino acid permease n=1 Tax=Propionigenium maris DSM 9537 TaxID=1123000 RepID=A0A9W6GIR7_9FUSO|nr:APC family permease [Propionigenium maris]GLI54913.1 amino acid permease [Propionigenium maris DSM 9537]